MRHLCARQVDPKSDSPFAGKYHYVSMGRSGGYPIGHCSPYLTCPECLGSMAPDCEECGGKGFIKLEAPCSGHDTPEQAEEHYRQWLLDKLRFDGRCTPNQQFRCEFPGCETWTQRIIDVEGEGYTHWLLCDEHANRESVDAILPKVGEAWES
jgi:hypothetical protein